MSRSRARSAPPRKRGRLKPLTDSLRTHRRRLLRQKRSAPRSQRQCPRVARCCCAAAPACAVPVRTRAKTWRIASSCALFPDAARAALVQAGAEHHPLGAACADAVCKAKVARPGRGKQILRANRVALPRQPKDPARGLSAQPTRRSRFSVPHVLARASGLTRALRSSIPEKRHFPSPRVRHWSATPRRGPQAGPPGGVGGWRRREQGGRLEWVSGSRRTHPLLGGELREGQTGTHVCVFGILDASSRGHA